MTARQTEKLLVVVVIMSLLNLTDSFQSLNSFAVNSTSHLDITQMAVLRKTAEICRDIAASEGRNFSLNIDNSLSADAVQRACSSGNASSSLLFQNSIGLMQRFNAIVDFDFQQSEEHHFYSETFLKGREVITAGVAVVKSSIRRGNLDSARRALGQVFHTLQDFYSHSNWIELGNNAPYNVLIRPDQPLKNLAEPNTSTCRNCTGENCNDNLLPDLLQQGLLTSGYFNSTSSAKPSGKCSHGGSFDQTSKQDPVGGISKDAVGSSHGFLHHKAAEMAVDATLELLEDIRIVAGNRIFLRLMGVFQSPVLCFVIDTTGTMGIDIFFAKMVVNSIIDSKRGTLQEPSLYILVPFNDPAFGPAIVTTNADEFKDSMNKLTASGGGDIPEMSLSGLQLALTAAPPSSEIFVFTDAPAKDSQLKNTIIGLIESTKSVVTFMLTDVTARRRRRRSSHGVFRRALTQSDAQLYQDLAQASGGQTIEVTKVTVFQAVQNPGRPDNFTFTVDGLLKNIIVYITGASSLTFSLNSSQGLTQSSSQSSGPLFSLITVGNLRRLKLNTENQTGLWQISVGSNNPYSVKVIGQSPLDFIFYFVEEREGVHGNNIKEGRILAGGNVSALVFLTDSNTVRVTEVILFDSSGPTEVKGSLKALGRGIYQADFTGIPGGVFVLRLKGEESSSTSRSTPNTFQRQSTLKITTSTIFITAKSSATSIEANSSVSVPFTVAITTNGVVNDSAAGTFTVRANNDRGYASTSPNTVTIEAGSGGTANGTVTLTVPANAASGTDVTLTIEAQDAAATDINYTVLRFSVIERVTDIASPVCQEVSISPICPSSSSLCASSQWEFIANFTDGISGTGIESISISQGNGTLNEIKMVGAGGESITRVTYSASCCFLNVELVAVDRVGNVGRCVGQVRQSTTAAPVTTTVTTAAPATTTVTTAAPATTTVTTAAPATTAVTTAAPVTTAVTTAAPVTTAVNTAAPATTVVATAAPATTAKATAAPATTAVATAAPATIAITTIAPVTTTVTTAASVTTAVSTAAPASTAVATAASVISAITTTILLHLVYF
ncbi:von Willebrand factor A domain-containing protein 7-like isoform 2-T2 [Odontesthes bonariensis]|uniref:von Willebrand factor A domain-containing protein 7-like isoform X2 n=1 Tax=Odontesthes bonariensis TaxID=219752 RepID=UPI003F58355B